MEDGIYSPSININQSQFYISTGKTIWQLILEQFDDLLVKILLLAAIISFVSIRVSIWSDWKFTVTQCYIQNSSQPVRREGRGCLKVMKRINLLHNRDVSHIFSGVSYIFVKICDLK